MTVLLPDVFDVLPGDVQFPQSEDVNNGCYLDRYHLVPVLYGHIPCFLEHLGVLVELTLDSPFVDEPFPCEVDNHWDFHPLEEIHHIGDISCCLPGSENSPESTLDDEIGESVTEEGAREFVHFHGIRHDPLGVSGSVHGESVEEFEVGELLVDPDGFEGLGELVGGEAGEKVSIGEDHKLLVSKSYLWTYKDGIIAQSVQFIPSKINI